MELQRTTVNVGSVLTDATFTAVIPGNLRRHALIISNNSGVTIVVEFGATPASSEGVNLTNGSFLELPGVHYGDAIRDKITLRGSAGSQRIAWAEFLESP